MKSKNRIMIVGLVATLAINTALAYEDYDVEKKNYTIQALLGGVVYDDLVFETNDGDDGTYTDMSTLPQLGGAWGTLPKGEKLQFGLEASFLLGFKFDDVTTYNGNNAVYVDVSSSLWLFDIAGGAYANLPLGNKLRLYAGAGPLMMIGIYNSDSSFGNIKVSETAYGFGAYARTGLELRVHNGGFLGAGVRGNWCNIDFSDVGGASEISGTAVFLTYTAGM